MQNFFSLKNTSGISLVETLISGAILALFMASVLWLAIYSVQISQSARLRTNSLQLARSRMERLIRVGYYSPELAIGTHNINMGGVTQGEIIVSNNENFPGDAVDVIVRIFYDHPTRTGQTGQVELRGVISRVLS